MKFVASLLWVLHSQLLARLCFCGTGNHAGIVAFRMVVKSNTTLPQSIQVFAGESYRHDGLPVRVWRVEIDYSDTNLTARPFLSKSPNGQRICQCNGNAKAARLSPSMAAISI